MNSLGILSKEKIIAVIRGANKNNVEKICEVMRKSQIKCLEITVEKEDAYEAIKFLSNQDDFFVGAGTVLSISQAEKAIKSGAKYLFAPIKNDEVIRYVTNNDVEMIPGVFTPTEVYDAYKLGVKAVKIFPISNLGPFFIKNFKSLLPQMYYFVTGGVNLNNAKSFLDNGADVVGMGKWLIDVKYIDDDKYCESIIEYANKCREAISTI